MYFKTCIIPVQVRFVVTQHVFSAIIMTHVSLCTLCSIIVSLTQVEYTDLVWQSGLCNLQTACCDLSSEFVLRKRMRDIIC